MNEIVESLDKQLDRVNVWLAFSEAKNVAIIALNAAIIAALIDLNIVPEWLSISIIIAVIFSTIASLISFIPGNLKETGKKTTQEKVNNMLYWYDIALIGDHCEYLQRFIERYFTDYAGKDINAHAMCLDLAEEIMENSKITNKKCRLFKVAILIDIFVFLSCCVIMIIA